MFQICERRKHQLIESHVTCYSVQKTVNSESGVPFQIRRMKLDVFPSVCLTCSTPTTPMEAICCSFSLLSWYALADLIFSSIDPPHRRRLPSLPSTAQSVRCLQIPPLRSLHPRFLGSQRRRDRGDDRRGGVCDQPISPSALQLHVDRHFL